MLTDSLTNVLRQRCQFVRVILSSFGNALLHCESMNQVISLVLVGENCCIAWGSLHAIMAR